MKVNAFCIIFTIFVSNTFPATFYVSTSGNDSFSTAEAQNRETPWKSLLKVGAQPFSPGDSILFKRGDEWSGTLQISSSGELQNNIYYGAYGIGENPVIKGTEPVAGSWSLFSGQIYYISFSDSCQALFINGNPLPLARHPNSGYLTIDTVTDSVTFCCANLPSIDWSGAKAHIRTEHWTIATKTINQYVQATNAITLSSVPVYTLRKGWGFFINNALAALDTINEWYWSAVEGRLYLMANESQTPASLTFEASIHPYGISAAQKSFITISGFTLFGQSKHGIWLNNVNNVMLINNRILYSLDSHKLFHAASF